MNHMIKYLKNATVFGLSAVVFLAAHSPVGAQARVPGDFLFQSPRATISLNLGYGLPAAASDLFLDIDTIFTLGKSDFNAPVIGGSLALYLNDQMDVVVDLSYAGSSTWSEYVDWTEYLDGRGGDSYRAGNDLHPDPHYGILPVLLY